MNLSNLFRSEKKRREVLAEGRVVPDNTRCVQCGICSYHCPIAIDVRRHAWEGIPVVAGHCLTCGECVERCPRGVLSFERIPVLSTPESKPDTRLHQ
ncbi:MAG: 4Fe-4S dicluster domain-containing protein [Anaerolineales bacterium]|nr:4Fe-4S dicluster domain-containing protein [Anaerolineales bacterium]